MEEESPASSYEYAPQETNPPSNVGHPPPSNPSYQTNLTLTYTPPSNVADSSSHAAYPPPIDAAKYPPPPISVSSLHASQKLPGYAGNPGPVPEKFPSEKYPPAFQQHASMSTVDSVGYPVQRSPRLAPGGVVAQETSRWSTGLFDCMDDPGNAVTTFLVPCVTFGQIAEIIDEGRSSCNTNGVTYSCVAFLIGMPCLVSCGYRSRLRAKFNLVETPAPDWVVHFFFDLCALCQEYRELRNRGFDPDIGWHANVAKNQGVALTPPRNQTMIG